MSDTPAAMSKAAEELTFREAMQELDSVVRLLESNTLELEASLESYQRGVELLASLQKRLDAAQQRVDVLMGTLEAEPDDKTRDSVLS